MIEGKQSQLVFTKELEFANDFSRLIRQTLGIEAQIKVHSVIEGDKQTKAYRIRLSQRDACELSLVLATDFDDTLEKYTKRKQVYHQHLAEMLLENGGLTTLVSMGDIVELLAKINKIARCLPIDGTHPEYYVPKLELLMETYLLDLGKRSPTEFAALVLLDAKALREHLVQALGQQLETVKTIEKQDKTGKPKQYFLEKIALAMEIDLGTASATDINQELWQLFVKDMTGANLDEKEVAGMAIPEEAYWLITTFGAAQFQIRKVVAGLRKLQEQGQRLPDELVIITQGRKDIFLQELFGNLLQVLGQKIIYLDDSEGQLESVTRKLGEAVHCFWAVKTGALRTALLGESSNKSTAFPSINLDQTPLREFVEGVLKKDYLGKN